MSDLIDRQAAIDALEKVAELFPWKVPENRDSYDRYNEAWNDAIGRAEIEIEILPSAQPEVRTQMSSADCISRQAAINACRLPELIPGICEGCRDYLYCHRQLTLDDIKDDDV